MALAEATPDELRRDVALAADAGLDLLRIHGHITRPELYEAADELGMLIWQDLPLQWGYARSVGKQAARQADEAVDLLGHHPSVAIWCGHNEPVAHRRAARRADHEPRRHGLRRRPGAAELEPLDPRSPASSGRSNGPTAPARSSRTPGVRPHLPQLDGTDSHLYFGWYHGQERDLPGFAAAWPRMVRFVSEFGAQAVPDDAGVHGARALARPRLGPPAAAPPRLQKCVFDERVPPGRYATFDGVADATQRVPGPPAAPSHRDAAPAEVPADGRLLPVQPGRRRTRP